MGLVVKTQIDKLVKETSKAKGYKVNSVSEDFLAVANEKVKKMVEDAVDRAHSNSRKTVMGKDL